MWKILICDNDYGFLLQFKKEILALAEGKVRQIELFRDKEQLEFYIEDNPEELNIVILNISLNGVSGIDVAKRVLELQPDSQIIFMSVCGNYYLDVYSVEHVYFLTKPIDREHLKTALKRAGDRIHDLQASSLMISNKEGIHRIPFNEILFFENERRKIHVHTINGKHSYYGKFEDLIAKLDDRFKRCHNSYIVNITRVRELSDKKFYLETGKMIPISKTYYSGVRESFLVYLGKDVFKGGGIRTNEG